MTTKVHRKLTTGIWLTTLLLVSGFEGCRFGNHVEQATPSEGTVASYDGYYGLAPQRLTFCADHSSTECAPAAANLIPDMLTSVFTNPVILVQDTEDPSLSWFVSNDENQYSLPTWIGEDLSTISYSGSTTPATLWDDPACTSTLFIDELGERTDEGQGETAVTGEPLSGRIELTVTVIRTFDGDCGSSLAAIQACFDDSTTCGGGSAEEDAAYQADLQALFGPYIDNGTMTGEDIPLLKSIAYEVKYE
jgi:hypothetical protein